MLATNPVDPDLTFRFGTLTAVGAHSHIAPRGEKGLGGSLNFIGAAALLVIGYIVGGAATASTSASVDVPRPVDLGGGPAAIVRTVDHPVPGEFLLGPGNNAAPGIVRSAATLTAPVPGEFRLGPGNDPAPGIVRSAALEPVTGEFRLGPGNATPPGIAR